MDSQEKSGGAAGENHTGELRERGSCSLPVNLATINGREKPVWQLLN